VKAFFTNPHLFESLASGCGQLVEDCNLQKIIAPPYLHSIQSVTSKKAVQIEHLCNAGVTSTGQQIPDDFLDMLDTKFVVGVAVNSGINLLNLARVSLLDGHHEDGLY